MSLQLDPARWMPGAGGCTAGRRLRAPYRLHRWRAPSLHWQPHRAQPRPPHVGSTLLHRRRKRLGITAHPCPIIWETMQQELQLHCIRRPTPTVAAQKPGSGCACCGARTLLGRCSEHIY